MDSPKVTQRRTQEVENTVQSRTRTTSASRQKDGTFLEKRRFFLFVVICQAIFIILMGALGTYEESAFPHTILEHRTVKYDYPLFQDVHVMIFVGFGFLMTFLKQYGYSSISMNLLIAAFVIQWHTIFLGFFEIHHSKFHVGIPELILSEFCAGAVLISVGAVLGKLSPLQYLVMALLEVIFYTINEYLIFEVFAINDVGGSMNLHLFGAYFGIAVAWITHFQFSVKSPKKGSVYHSDLFSMIGTLFLWMYWPSFNGAIADPLDGRHRAIINTYFSLAACAVVTFALSSMVHKDNKFDMEHIQNATLAGGVAMGTAANLIIYPWAAMLIGSIAAVISVLGYTYIGPLLHSKFHLHDTCGVHYLHGLPGLLGGIVGVIAAGVASPGAYGASCLCLGLILKISIWDNLEHEEVEYFDDTPFFHLPDEMESTAKKRSGQTAPVVGMENTAAVG